MPVLAPHMPRNFARSAFELFAERGFAAVNLDQIAARSGVTKGSLYHHYGSKKELILSACQHYYRNWMQNTQAELAPLTDPLERLTAVLESSVRTCVIDRRNRVFTTEIWAMALYDNDVRASWAQFYDSVRETYVGLVESARSAGQLRTSNPRQAVDFMLSTMEGIKQRASFEPEVAAPAEQQAILANLLSTLGVKEKRRSCRRTSSVVRSPLSVVGGHRSARCN
ncbi:MAG TPA: TetR/AcrR family transcriptional regulator [Planctomycetota bacterium]|jgi:AcrR family transcriptional regulator